MESLKNRMKNAGTELGNKASGALTTVEDNAKSAASSVRGELGQGLRKVQGFSSTAWGNLKNAATNVENAATSVGTRIKQGTRKLRGRVGGVKRRRKSTKKRMRKRRSHRRKNLKGGTNATPEQAQGIMKNMALLNDFDQKGVLEGMGSINHALGGTLNSLKNNLGELNKTMNKENNMANMKGGKRRRKGKKSKKMRKRKSRKSKKIYGGDGDTPDQGEDNNDEESESEPEPEPEPETKSEPPVEVKTNSKQGHRIATEDNPCGIWESLTKRCMSQKQHDLVQEKKKQEQCIKDCKSKTEGGRRKRRKRGTKKKRKHR